MKKRIFITSLIIALTLMTALPAYASSDVYTAELFPDGSYTEVTIAEDDAGSLFALLSSSSSKTGSKTVTYKNAAGATLWYVRVTGGFTYNGSSSTCTSSSVTAASNNTYWTVSNRSHSKSGNRATASATAKQYDQYSVLLNTVNQSVHLYCSANGTLS